MNSKNFEEPVEKSRITLFFADSRYANDTLYTL